MTQPSKQVKPHHKVCEKGSTGESQVWAETAPEDVPVQRAGKNFQPFYSDLNHHLTLTNMFWPADTHFIPAVFIFITSCLGLFLASLFRALKFSDGYSAEITKPLKTVEATIQKEQHAALSYKHYVNEYHRQRLLLLTQEPSIVNFLETAYTKGYMRFLKYKAQSFAVKFNEADFNDKHQTTVYNVKYIQAICPMQESIYTALCEVDISAYDDSQGAAYIKALNAKIHGIVITQRNLHKYLIQFRAREIIKSIFSKAGYRRPTVIDHTEKLALNHAYKQIIQLISRAYFHSYIDGTYANSICFQGITMTFGQLAAHIKTAIKVANTPITEKSESPLGKAQQQKEEDILDLQPSSVAVVSEVDPKFQARYDAAFGDDFKLTADALMAFLSDESITVVDDAQVKSPAATLEEKEQPLDQSLLDYYRATPLVTIDAELLYPFKSSPLQGTHSFWQNQLRHCEAALEDYKHTLSQITEIHPEYTDIYNRLKLLKNIAYEIRTQAAATDNDHDIVVLLADPQKINSLFSQMRNLRKITSAVFWDEIIAQVKAAIAVNPPHKLQLMKLANHIMTLRANALGEPLQVAQSEKLTVLQQTIQFFSEIWRNFSMTEVENGNRHTPDDVKRAKRLFATVQLATKEAQVVVPAQLKKSSIKSEIFSLHKQAASKRATKQTPCCTLELSWIGNGRITIVPRGEHTQFLRVDDEQNIFFGDELIGHISQDTPQNTIQLIMNESSSHIAEEALLGSLHVTGDTQDVKYRRLQTEAKYEVSVEPRHKRVELAQREDATSLRVFSHVTLIERLMRQSQRLTINTESLIKHNDLAARNADLINLLQLTETNPFIMVGSRHYWKQVISDTKAAISFLLPLPACAEIEDCNVTAEQQTEALLHHLELAEKCQQQTLLYGHRYLKELDQLPRIEHTYKQEELQPEIAKLYGRLGIHYSDLFFYVTSCVNLITNHDEQRAFHYKHLLAVLEKTCGQIQFDESASAPVRSMAMNLVNHYEDCATKISTLDYITAEEKAADIDTVLQARANELEQTLRVLQQNQQRFSASRLPTEKVDCAIDTVQRAAQNLADLKTIESLEVKTFLVDLLRLKDVGRIRLYNQQLSDLYNSPLPLGNPAEWQARYENYKIATDYLSKLCADLSDDKHRALIETKKQLMKERTVLLRNLTFKVRAQAIWLQSSVTNKTDKHMLSNYRKMIQCIFRVLTDETLQEPAGKCISLKFTGDELIFIKSNSGTIDMRLYQCAPKGTIEYVHSQLNEQCLDIPFDDIDHAALLQETEKARIVRQKALEAEANVRATQTIESQILEAEPVEPRRYSVATAYLAMVQADSKAPSPPAHEQQPMKVQQPRRPLLSKLSRLFKRSAPVVHHPVVPQSQQHRCVLPKPNHNH